ncbi:MAG: hypothetical protein WBD87_11570 [Candidatus Acidiferrales bacterium]
MASLDAGQGSKIAEISGWDTEENFFVEKAILHGRGDGNSKVDLQARLHVGLLVFVRLSEEASMDRAVPVTYQVSGVDGNANNEVREVRLSRLRPKEAATTAPLEFRFRETAVN